MICFIQVNVFRGDDLAISESEDVADRGMFVRGVGVAMAHYQRPNNAPQPEIRTVETRKTLLPKNAEFSRVALSQ